ncbi:PepSY domain-containing protein [Brevundimonas sp.]|uniref:PepSY domain-containing protein n=1 Tax=Brevundimonas sp. TaxID=1871086 RepID=UPI002FC7C279
MSGVVRLSTQIHKWVSLVIGLQVVFWVVGGLVMVSIPIERVRSEHHVREVAAPPLPAAVLPLARVAALTGVQPTRAELRSTLRGPVWILREGAEGDPVTVSALTGAPLPAMTAAQARAAAVAAYTGEGVPTRVDYLATPPQETGRETPVWRVDFSDAERTTFYVSPQTAEVETRRSAVWRLYDFMWRLHILDLKNGEDSNSPLLIGVTALTLLLLVTGLILLVVRLHRDWVRQG